MFGAIRNEFGKIPEFRVKNDISIPDALMSAFAISDVGRGNYSSRFQRSYFSMP